MDTDCVIGSLGVWVRFRLNVDDNSMVKLTVVLLCCDADVVLVSALVGELDAVVVPS